ncbi:MAG: isoprenyl transferase [Weeksellaceae bacterium]|nr:isoprenyl transferase [Weeksellaceae bacterium]
MQASIKNTIDLDKVPQHVAIIMDGNGRWARKKGMMRTFGHQNALKAVRSAMEACEDLGIPYLTLYAFSSENWSRPSDEVNFLMNLLVRSLRKELSSFQKNNIRLRTIGEIEKLPSGVQKELEEVKEQTKNNTNGTLIVALSYGSKDEIVQAVKKIAADVRDNELEIEDINTDKFKSYLFTADVPDVDLMIRTSGESRISNFMLWQIAYAELYFTDVLWPDFRKKDFFDAIIDYQKRERRYGNILEN